MGALDRLRSEVQRQIRVYQLVLGDPRTPSLARWLLGAAVAYALSPVDLLPDFVPGIGHLDDALVVPLLVWIALRLVPREVIEAARARAAD